MDDQQDSVSRKLEAALPAIPLVGITGVILAGGESSRMGSDKAFLSLLGARLIDRVYISLATLFPELLIVTNNPQHYSDIPCRKVADLYPGHGALAGIHSGLVHAASERVFVVACDMPFVSPVVVRYLCSFAAQGDMVLPYSSGGHEPLHAVYAKTCLPAIEQVLKKGQRRVGAFFDQVKVIKIFPDEITRFGSLEKCFYNINTPEDYYRLRNGSCTDVPSQVSVKKIRKQIS